VIVRQSLAEVPARERALALGSFDGVHLGHEAVIAAAVDAAGRYGIGSAVVTFQPHPLRVLRPALAPPELSSPSRRAALIEQLGVDELVLLRFDKAFAGIEHERFSEQVLAATLGARQVVVGRNFRYGHGARGSVETLREEGSRLGFEVMVADLVELDGEPVSSSRIRELVESGLVEQAARLLGRPPWVEGAVVRGDGRGRALGFPTANLALLPRRAIPGVGVYAGWAHVPGLARPAAINVGWSPQFQDDRTRIRVEAHLLDFDGDLYGSPLRVELVRRLRDELRFESVEALLEQMQRDVDETRRLIDDAQRQAS
jgi:riboflavin kinase/FMN adenylyltransferase